MIEYNDFVECVFKFVDTAFNNPVEGYSFHPLGEGNYWDCVCGVNDPKLYFVLPQFERLMVKIHFRVFDEIKNLLNNMYLNIQFENCYSDLIEKISSYLYLLHEVCEINGYESIDAGIQMTNFLYLLWEKRKNRFGLRKIRDIYYRNRNKECVREEMLNYLVD